MSNLYPQYYMSQFPDEIDSYEYMQDLNLETYALAKEYETLMGQNKFDEASKLLIDNPQLNRIMFNAEKYNKLIDSIKCIETLYKDDIRTYVLELMSFKGDYNNTTKYIRYNVVRYNSRIYLCISDCPLGTLPTDETYWYELSIKGDKGDSGKDGMNLCFNGIWNKTKTYNKDSAVSYDNKLFASLQDNNIGHTPAENEWWTLVVNFDSVVDYNNGQSGLEANTVQEAIDVLAEKTSKINNTPDSEKSVNSATYDSEGAHIHNTFNAINETLNNKLDTNASCNKNWIWYGQGGQPTWLWGGEDGIDMYVYNPANFNVNHANSSGNSDAVDGLHACYGVHNEYGLRSIAMDTFELTAGVTPMTTGTIYIQYE